MKRTSRVFAYGAATVLSISLLAVPGARAEEKPDCHVNVNTDDGKGGTQVQQCDNSVSIGASGPIKDVDVAHPGGKGKAFIPQAGRDAQGIVQQGGHAIEDGAHWVGNRLGIH